MPIQINELTVYANQRQRSAPIISGICGMLQEHTLTLVIGRTGSGKTTLLRALAGLAEIGGGSVCYDGVPLWNKGRLNRSLLLRNAVAFQFPEHQLFARTVQAEFEYSLRAYRLPKPERLRRIDAALEGQRLPRSVLPLSPFTLSGGQKRRVALATIQAAEAPWLLLDEPSAGLDAKSAAQLREELIRAKAHSGIVLVTHDWDAFLPIADKVLVLDNGRLAADLTPAELHADPTLLERLGIGLAGALELIQALRRTGMRIPADAWSAEQIAAAAAAHLGGGKQQGASLRSRDLAPGPATAAVPAPAAVDPHDSAPALASGSMLSSPQQPLGSTAPRPAPTELVYMLDAKLKWLIYTLLSAGVIVQTKWLGLFAAMLIAAACVSLLRPEERRKLLRMTQPLLLFVAVAAFISGIRIDVAAVGVALPDRFHFSIPSLLETLRRLFGLFDITLLGLVFTLSTSTSNMKQGLEAALRPLKRLRVPTEMLALAASLVLRFIPLIIEETERFATIAKARGKRTARQGQIDMRDIPGFVIPLLISLFQAVEELVLAMELKGYMKRPVILPLGPPPDKTLNRRALGIGLALFAAFCCMRWFI